MSFYDVFEKAAAKTGLTFVAESFPKDVYPLLGQEWETALESLDRSALDKQPIRDLAQAFDYACEFKGKIVILRKQFSQNDDLPDVTSGECERFLESLPEIVARFSNHNKSLSPSELEQFAELRTVAEAVPVSRLNDMPRRLLWRLLLQHFINTALSTNDWVISDLCELQIRPGRFGLLDFYGTRGYGYEVPRPLGAPLQIRVQLQVGRATRSMFFLYSHSNVAPRLTAKDVEEHVNDHAPKELPSLPEGAIRLQELDRLCSGCRVDTVLKSKVVSIFGESNVDPVEIVQAVAQLYSLDCRLLTEGSLFLTRNPVAPALAIEEIPEAVRQSVPASLLRYVERRNGEPEAVPEDKFEHIRARHPIPSLPREPLPLFSPHALQSLNNEAVKRLQLQITFAIDGETDRVVSLPDEQMKALLSLISLTTSLPRIESLTLPIPRYLTQFEDAVFRCAIRNRGTDVMLNLEITIPDGGGWRSTFGLSTSLNA